MNRSYSYSKKRRHFGSQLLFQAEPAEMLDSIPSNKDDQKQYILRNPVHEYVQASPTYSEHEANTTRVIIKEQGINHTEGGWPRDVNLDNEELVGRYCRRIQHDDNYIHTVFSLSPIMDHCIQQNNAIEMYQTYYADLPHQPPVEQYKVQISNEFRDTLNRPISCLVWTNENESKLAVSYLTKKSNGSSLNKSNNCYLWDISRQNKPAAVFYPSTTCLQLACSAVDPEVLVAGLDNGTVCLFDLRASQQCIANSSIYNSHRNEITALLYMSTRTNSEFFTGSTDGQCLWWDQRNLSMPVDSLPICLGLHAHEEPDLGKALGISSLQYDQNLPTKFLCGTESGLVVSVNRMGKEYSEKISAYWNTHTGPVHAVQRSKCTLRMFLTCGDYSLRIWSDEVRTAPIVVFNPYRSQVLSAAWAPLRYSCFMSVCSDGSFHYWDLLRKYNEPVASHKVSEHKLTNVTPHANGEYIAVADDNGSIHLLKVPECMAIPGEHDKHFMQQLYERETKREHILDNRLKEIRLKARQEEEAALLADSGEAPPMPEESDEDEIDKQTEEDYWRIVNEEISKIIESTQGTFTV